MARPKGSKSMKKVVTPDEINQIKTLFISGTSITEIKNKFNLSSANWIYTRMEKEGWLEERERFFERKNKQYLDNILSGTLEETKKVIEDLRTIREKAIGPIDTGELSPRKYSEASSSYISAVELERRLKVEGVNLLFVMKVAEILKNKIKDTILLSEIAIDLRKLFEQERKELVGPMRNVEIE